MWAWLRIILDAAVANLVAAAAALADQSAVLSADACVGPLHGVGAVFLQHGILGSDVPDVIRSSFYARNCQRCDTTVTSAIDVFRRDDP